ncbi:MAG: hypothetical protein R2710_08030 [Acidimicrobiales bacterium]
MIAREFSCGADVLVVAQPTRGVDIGAGESTNACSAASERGGHPPHLGRPRRGDPAIGSHRRRARR